MSGHGGGGRGGRRRGGHAEEHENHERWLVTYADMLTLLFVLFVVLYAISAVNTSKFEELKASLSSAFKNGQPSVLSGGSGVVAGGAASSNPQLGPQLPRIGSAASSGPTPAAKTESQEFAKIQESAAAALKAKGLDANASFTVNERGLVIHVLAKAVFPGDSAALQPEGAQIIDAIIPSLNAVDNKMTIDGHTNQLASSADPWVLSGMRATTVLEYLIAHNVSRNRLNSAGYADVDPLIPASDPRSETLNRRVDIVVVSKYALSERVGLFAGSTATTGSAATTGSTASTGGTASTGTTATTGDSASGGSATATTGGIIPGTIAPPVIK